MHERGALIVISGFSGAGKGTIVKRIISENENISLSISMTTRSPRPGEVNGREYFFVSKEEFEKAIKEDKLLEHASYVDNYYGTPKDYVLNKLNEGNDVILEIETNGALQIKEKFNDAVLIFVATPSIAILKERLIGRGTESQEVVNNRINKAAAEVNLIEKYDYLLVNDDLDKCVNELYTLIDAVHHAPSNNSEFIEKLKKEF